MASIYSKGAKKTLILEPREGFFRQFDFSDWTELRIGMILSAVAGTGPNDNSVNETLTIVDASDYVTFGIKNSGTALPGQTGSLFVGMRASESTVISQPSQGIGGPSGPWKAFTSDGTSMQLASAAFVTGGDGRIGQCDPTGASAYATFVGLKIVVNNRGFSNQSVTLSCRITGAISGSDYFRTALRTLLNNETYFGAQTLAWNDGVSAKTLPDCFFFRSPLFLNRARIASIRAIRYA